MVSVGAAALAASAITAAASLGITWVNSRLQSRAASGASRRRALSEVLSGSLEVVQRSHMLSVIAAQHSSPLSGVRILLGVEKPAEVQALLEPLLASQGRLNAAVGDLWLSADQKLIDAANEVSLAVAGIIDALMEPKAMKRALHGRHDPKVQAALEQVAGARWALTREARERRRWVSYLAVRKRPAHSDHE